MAIINIIKFNFYVTKKLSRFINLQWLFVHFSEKCQRGCLEVIELSRSKTKVTTLKYFLRFRPYTTNFWFLSYFKIFNFITEKVIKTFITILHLKNYTTFLMIYISIYINWNVFNTFLFYISVKWALYLVWLS